MPPKKESKSVIKKSSEKKLLDPKLEKKFKKLDDKAEKLILVIAHASTPEAKLKLLKKLKFIDQHSYNTALIYLYNQKKQNFSKTKEGEKIETGFKKDLDSFMDFILRWGTHVRYGNHTKENLQHLKLTWKDTKTILSKEAPKSAERAIKTQAYFSRNGYNFIHAGILVKIQTDFPGFNKKGEQLDKKAVAVIYKALETKLGDLLNIYALNNKFLDSLPALLLNLINLPKLFQHDDFASLYKDLIKENSKYLDKFKRKEKPVKPHLAKDPGMYKENSEGKKALNAKLKNMGFNKAQIKKLFEYGFTPANIKQFQRMGMSIAFIKARLDEGISEEKIRDLHDLLYITEGMDDAELKQYLKEQGLEPRVEPVPDDFPPAKENPSDDNSDLGDFNDGEYNPSNFDVTDKLETGGEGSEEGSDEGPPLEKNFDDFMDFFGTGSFNLDEFMGTFDSEQTFNMIDQASDTELDLIMSDLFDSIEGETGLSSEEMMRIFGMTDTDSDTGQEILNTLVNQENPEGIVDMLMSCNKTKFSILIQKLQDNATQNVQSIIDVAKERLETEEDEHKITRLEDIITGLGGELE